MVGCRVPSLRRSEECKENIVQGLSGKCRCKKRSISCESCSGCRIFYVASIRLESHKLPRPARKKKLDDGWPESEKDVFQAALSMVVVKNSR